MYTLRTRFIQRVGESKDVDPISGRAWGKS